MDADIVTAVEAAAILGRSKDTIYGWRKKKLGPRPKFAGGRWFYSRKECEEYAKLLSETGRLLLPARQQQP